MVKNIYIGYIFIFGMIVNLFLPVINLPGIGIYPVYIFSIFFAIIWLSIIFDSDTTYNVSSKIMYVISIIFIMFISFAFTSIYGMMGSNLKYFLYEIFSYIFMIPFLLLFNRIEISDRQIHKTIIFCFIIFCLIGVLQWLGFKRAVTLYAFKDHVEPALEGSRLTLTGSDPNVGSIIGSFFLLYFISIFLIKRSALYLLLSFIAVAFIFKTQGRTTIIGSGVSIVFYFFLVQRANIFYKILIGSFIGFSIFYLSRQFDLFYLIEGITNLSEGKNKSVNVRVDNIGYAFDSFLRSPIYGWGSSLEQYGVVKNVDSEYFLILQRYGVLGAIVISTIIFKLIKIGFLYRKQSLGVFIFLLVISLLFNMLTNVVFFGVQTISIVVFLIFLSYYLESNTVNPT